MAAASIGATAIILYRKRAAKAGPQLSIGLGLTPTPVSFIQDSGLLVAIDFPSSNGFDPIVNPVRSSFERLWRLHYDHLSASCHDMDCFSVRCKEPYASRFRPNRSEGLTRPDVPQLHTPIG